MERLRSGLLPEETRGLEAGGLDAVEIFGAGIEEPDEESEGESR